MAELQACDERGAFAHLAAVKPLSFFIDFDFELDPVRSTLGVSPIDLLVDPFGSKFELII